MIELKSLSKAYANGEHQDFILENIDFNISSNDFVGLRGRSGSGKSTLLNIIGLIDDITSGQYFFDGLDLTKMSEFEKTNLRRKNFGFIFQNFNLISSMNVFENIEYPLLLLETSKSQREKLVSDIIDVVGLQGLGRRFPSEISGGQRQRVAIARAIVKKPKIIIADEPTANLDSENANMIGELFQNIYKMNQLTIICCSHDDSLLKSANQVYEIKNRKMSLK